MAALMRDMDTLSSGTSVWKVPRGFFASIKKVNLQLVRLKEISMSGKASLERSMRDGAFGISWGSKKSRREDTIFSLHPSSIEVFEGQSHGMLAKKNKAVKAKVGNNREQWSFTVKNHARELDIVATSQSDYDKWIKFLRQVKLQK
jgi:hypothetical protein